MLLARTLQSLDNLNIKAVLFSTKPVDAARTKRTAILLEIPSRQEAGAGRDCVLRDHGGSLSVIISKLSKKQSQSIALTSML